MEIRKDGITGMYIIPADRRDVIPSFDEGFASILFG